MYFCQYTVASPVYCKLWWGKMPQWPRINLVVRRHALITFPAMGFRLEQRFRCLTVICCQFWRPGLQLLMQKSPAILWVVCHHWLPGGLVLDIGVSLHTCMRHPKSVPQLTWAIIRHHTGRSLFGGLAKAKSCLTPWYC